MTAAIRAAKPDDAASILELEKHFPSDRLSLRSVRHLIRSRSSTVLVAADPRIAGALVLLTRRGSRVARIYSIVVDGRARGQGLAARLLQRAEAMARAAGCHTMALEVRQDNAAALGLYARSGYAQTERLPGFYDDGAGGVRLRKRLRAPGPFPGSRGPGYNTGGSYARTSTKSG